jgi:hypothetical protein
MRGRHFLVWSRTLTMTMSQKAGVLSGELLLTLLWYPKVSSGVIFSVRIFLLC